jgi:hypothetical protein
VDVLRVELPAAVQVAEGVAEEGERGAEDLQRDMPPTLDDLESYSR